MRRLAALARIKFFQLPSNFSELSLQKVQKCLQSIPFQNQTKPEMPSWQCVELSTHFSIEDVPLMQSFFSKSLSEEEKAAVALNVSLS
jgi:hypothetical protein